MFHSGFAAPQRLSFWYPSSTDYGGKQKSEHKNTILCHYWFHHVMAVSYFMVYGQRPFHSGSCCPVGAQILAQTKRFYKLYVCIPERNRLLSYFYVACTVGLNSLTLYNCFEIRFALPHVCKWTMGQWILKKILLLSLDIIEWRKLQDFKKDQSSWSATYCK